MLPVKIRKAVPADVPRLMELWNQLMDFHVEHCGSGRGIYTFAPNKEAIYRKYLRAQMRSRNAAILVAEKEGCIRGYAHTSIKSLPPVYKYNKEAYVDCIIVGARWRRKGIGTALLGAAAAWAKKKGLRQVSLTVHVKNSNAQAAYRHAAFAAHRVKMIKLIC